MKIETFTYIEVSNVVGQWAVLLKDCKEEMKPDFPLFINVGNQIGKDFIVVDNTLCNLKPSKIENGISSGVSEDWGQAGFWHIHYKKSND
jgi:hypothetical protein